MISMQFLWQLVRIGHSGDLRTGCAVDVTNTNFNVWNLYFTQHCDVEVSRFSASTQGNLVETMLSLNFTQVEDECCRFLWLLGQRLFGQDYYVISEPGAWLSDDFIRFQVGYRSADYIGDGEFDCVWFRRNVLLVFKNDGDWCWLWKKNIFSLNYIDYDAIEYR